MMDPDELNEAAAMRIGLAKAILRGLSTVDVISLVVSIVAVLFVFVGGWLAFGLGWGFLLASAELFVFGVLSGLT